MNYYVSRPVVESISQKKTSTARFLMIVSFRVKIVLKIIRLILKAIYKPIFSGHNNGVRSSKSCQPVLQFIRKKFDVTTWYRKKDITRCFDSIEKQHLMALIEFKTHDKKFTCLI